MPGVASECKQGVLPVSEAIDLSMCVEVVACWAASSMTPQLLLRQLPRASGASQIFAGTTERAVFEVRFIWCCGRHYSSTAILSALVGYFPLCANHLTPHG